MATEKLFRDNLLIGMVNYLCQKACDNSKAKGFWPGGLASRTSITGDPLFNFGEKIALMHSELSEALEKHRKGLGKGLPDPPDEHCPEFGGIAIEFADLFIRLADLCGFMGIDLGSAILAKMRYNEGREPKHGKAY